MGDDATSNATSGGAITTGDQDVGVDDTGGGDEDTSEEDTSEEDASGEDVPEACSPDACEIDGACVPNEAVNPENGCEICLVLVDATAWTPNDAGTCDDEDACTEGDRCEEGECVGDPIVCDDGNACTDDICDSTTGECGSMNNTASCFDGDPCSVGDACADGACVGGGDTLDCDDGNPCTADRCEAGVGCVSEPMDGVACDDGNTCTANTMCTDGVCGGGEVMSCDDGSLCTVDSCDPELGCVNNSIADLCADANPCTDEVCDPEVGCVYPFNTNPCDDGSACTEGDVCTQGACLGAPVSLSDGNVCTDLTCDPETGVEVAFNTLPCDDSDACTLGDTCGDGMCVAGTGAPNCDDDNVCTDDRCDPELGCANDPNTEPCDDNNVCTIGDTCAEGGCAPGEERLDCDDGNPCTADRCDPELGCAHALINSFACRPAIDVVFPPRAATLQADTNQVNVRGSVSSDAGAITSLTINGVEVAVDEETDTFSYDFNAFWGANTLVIVAEDELGTVRKRVQGFHLGRGYSLSPADNPKAGAVSNGLAIWLGQQTLDDGQAPPPTDLAAIFKGVLDGIDVSDFFDPNQAVTRVGAIGVNFDIFIRSLDLGSTTVSLQATNNGLRLAASLNNVSGRIFIDCVSSSVACFFAGGDNGGDINIQRVDIAANVVLAVNPDNTLAVSLQDTTTNVVGGSISSDGGFQNFLLTIATALFIDVEDTLASALNSELSSAIGPLLSDALGALAFNLSFDLPRLDGAVDGGGAPVTIPVALGSDFDATSFQAADPQGGALVLRTWASTPQRGVPTEEETEAPFDDNLGVPLHFGCGTLGGPGVTIPRQAPIELVFPDTTLNQILRAAWWGGLLEFPIDPELLGGIDPDTLPVPISDLALDVSAWLPPLATECNEDGILKLTVSDLRIDASLVLSNQPIELVVYVSFNAPITLGAAEGQLSITVGSIEDIELEISAVEESMIPAEAAIEGLLIDELVPALGGLLGNGEPLASFPLPEVDLSASLDQPPGTSVIRILPIDPPASPRQPYSTVIYGRLE